MPASDWEQSSSETDNQSVQPASTAQQPTTIPAATITKNSAKSKWADEDAEATVPDSWSASDSEGEGGDDNTNKSSDSKATKAKTQAPVRNKGITKQKIAEKEAEERARLEEASREDDPVAKKQREQKRTLASDLENARSLFGDVATKTSNATLLDTNPKTIDEWTDFTTSLSKLLISKHGNKPHYPTFIDQLVKELVDPLDDTHCRRVSTSIATVANEKQRQLKEAAKKHHHHLRGKAKPALGGVGSSASIAQKGGKGLDLNAYDAPGLDDDYDFM